MEQIVGFLVLEQIRVFSQTRILSRTQDILLDSSEPGYIQNRWEFDRHSGFWIFG